MEAAEEYWTEEKMRAAKPIPIPIISEEQLSRIEAEAKFKSALRNNKKRKSIVIEASPNVDRSDWGDTLPGMKTTAGVPEEADVDQRPFWNAGRLYVTDPDSHEDYSCTAEFVTSNQILMTAAHCLMNLKGHWRTNVTFAPRVRGKERFKNSGTSCKAISGGWLVRGVESNGKDYGFVVAYRTGPGWLGLKTNIPYNNWTAIGYSTKYGNQLYLQRVDSSKGSVGKVAGINGNVVEMKNNPLRGGSSGGAWIAELNTGNNPSGNYAIGLNSFHFHEGTTSTSEYSPYFDNAVFDVLNKVKEDCKIN